MVKRWIFLPPSTLKSRSRTSLSEDLFMRTLRVIFVVLALSVVPLRAADQPDTLSQVEDRIISQEHQEITTLKQYSPLVETYIQELRADKDLGSVPAGDKYFLGRAD